jgi:hypothetical protein
VEGFAVVFAGDAVLVAEGEAVADGEALDLELTQPAAIEINRMRDVRTARILTMRLFITLSSGRSSPVQYTIAKASVQTAGPVEFGLGL